MTKKFVRHKGKKFVMKIKLKKLYTGDRDVRKIYEVFGSVRESCVDTKE